MLPDRIWATIFLNTDIGIWRHENKKGGTEYISRTWLIKQIEKAIEETRERKLLRVEELIRQGSVSSYEKVLQIVSGEEGER